jgi:hypothetical protein
VGDVPADRRGTRPEGAAHSPWELIEHIRIAQHDILEFSRNPDYSSPSWPEGYWPASPAPPEEAAWGESVEAMLADNQAMQDLVADGSADLYAPIPWGDGQTVLREAMLVADHNSYHLGQLATVRHLLGC